MKQKYADKCEYIESIRILRTHQPISSKVQHRDLRRRKKWKNFIQMASLRRVIVRYNQRNMYFQVES